MPLKETLYRLARNADPERKGIDSHSLWQRMVGTPAAESRDASSVYDALTQAQDLFEKMPGVANQWRWLETPRVVYQAADCALHGRRLAVVSHWLARSLDPAARGLHYYRYIDAVLASGERVTGANVGATVHGAITSATDLFELVAAGTYRWRRVPALEASGWMMRTNRDLAAWLWSEVEAGRLRQGWGSYPQRDLNILRARRERVSRSTKTTNSRGTTGECSPTNQTACRSVISS